MKPEFTSAAATLKEKSVRLKILFCFVFNISEKKIMYEFKKDNFTFI